MPDPTLRSFTPADYAPLADFLTRLHPEQPHRAEELERFDAGRLPGEHLARTLAFSGGELMGMVESERSRQFNGPGWYGLHVWTPDPGLRPRLERLGREALRPMIPRVLHTTVREDWPEYPLLRAGGWQEHERMWISTLELASFEAAAFEGHAERARAAGIEVRTLSELGWDGEEPGSNGAIQRRLYDLIVELLHDVPTADPVIPWPFEVWQRRYLSEDFTPDGPLIAVGGGEWAGLTELYQPVRAQPGTVRQGLTGVRRAWRGQGVAWALKLAGARRAREQGWRRILTGNHTVNHEMLGINQALGFVKEPARVVLRQDWQG